MSAYYCILLHCARLLNDVVCTGSPKLVSEIMALGMEGRHTEAQRTQRLLLDADYLGMTYVMARPPQSSVLSCCCCG